MSTTYSVEQVQEVDAPTSPPRPPVSPITPMRSFTDLASTITLQEETTQTVDMSGTFMEQPRSVPFDEINNPDVAAMRAAISILQMQRDKSQRDILTLEEIREVAAQDPERFRQELLSGGLTHESATSDPLSATFKDSEDPELDEHEGREAVEDTLPKLPKIPAPQNIFRCPPVNWDKYHIVGQGLEELDKAQKQMVNPGSAFKPSHTSTSNVASQYSPFQDTQAPPIPPEFRRG